MSTTAYFVSAQFIKDYTFVDENVDEKYLMVAIKEAQEIYIREYLGTGLYNDLTTNIVANTVSSNYQTLLNDYIVPALKYWAMYEAAPFLKFKFTNKNVVNKNSDNSSASDIKEFEKVMKWIEDKARFYTERCVRYLLQNQTTYPLYFNPGTGLDTIFPNMNGFDSDIYLGRGTLTNIITPKQYYERSTTDWPF